MTRSRRWLLLTTPILAVALIAANLIVFTGSAEARPLRGFASCGELLAHYQDEARRSQSPERYYDDVEVEAEDQQEAAQESAAADSGSAAESAPSDGGEVSETGTNVQERGVDESDIVKTDGEHLYVLRPQSLLIAELGDDGPPVEVGRIEFQDWAHRQELLIGVGKAIVVRQLEDAVSRIAPEVGDIAQPTWRPERVRPQSEILEIDIEDAASPRLLRELVLDGRFVSARLVDGAARVVFRHQAYHYWVGPWDFAWQRNAERDAAAYNEAVIENSQLGFWHPLFSHRDHANNEFESGYALDCDQTFAPDGADAPSWRQGVNYMLSFDLAEGLAERGSVGVMSDQPMVYASIGSLYLATPDRQWWNTNIHRFDIADPLEPSYFGSGSVRGQLLSQWAMSEHEGYLRVATTIQDRWPTVSNVFVLEPVSEGGEGRLEQVGLESGLGVTESIFAVRFAGDVGYVVTFRQVDPLYVLDLSDPTDPKSVGELKIPGFSRYLHPLSGGLLLGVGRDADPETGWERGLQATLFDVSDPANPTQLSVLPLGDDAFSPVESDHRAFRYQDGVAWIPVGPNDWRLRENHDGAFFGVRVTAEGLSHESTLRVHGEARRAIPIGGRIHLLSNEEIRTYNLADYTDLGALSFAPEWDNRWLPVAPQ
ncbi:MAG: beta-propeller domain-containing protein [Chloroflexi bacterium]|nr:beta-propeller domain-containing protein [Chloroflexota bacterium]